MADVVDRHTRSRMMAGIKGRDTKPELLVRKMLHRAGFRFRLNVSTLPGKPDIVLTKHRAAVFVHGCFWHRHAGCRFATTPATRREFWLEKLEANAKRDDHNRAALRELGWRTAYVWECGLRRNSNSVLGELESWLRSDFQHIEIGSS